MATLRPDRMLWMICAIAALGGLLFGYDWAVIGGAKPFYESYFEISDSPLWQGWGVTSALVGCLLGAVLSGVFSDRFGRKKLLVTAGVCFIASALGTGLITSFAAFNVYRILGGIGIGLVSSVSPMYIAEISPPGLRGRLVSLNQLTIVIGVLAAQVVNWLIATGVQEQPLSRVSDSAWLQTIGWRLMFAAEAVPATIYLVLICGVPESPRWLMTQGQSVRAQEIIERIDQESSADATVERIRQSLTQANGEAATLGELFRPPTFHLLRLGVFLAVFQQWCGINVVFNYAEEVFGAAGYSVGLIMGNIVLTGTVNLIFTVIAMQTVDRVGRRLLMLAGAGGLAVIYSLLGGCYFFDIQGGLPMSLVLGAIACYSMTLAPVTWVILAEIFPNRLRGTAIAICVGCLWGASAMLTFTFPFLNRQLSAHGTFWLYGSICVVGCLVIARKLPETCGRSLEAIDEGLWPRGNSQSN